MTLFLEVLEVGKEDLARIGNNAYEVFRSNYTSEIMYSRLQELLLCNAPRA